MGDFLWSHKRTFHQKYKTLTLDDQNGKVRSQWFVGPHLTITNGFPKTKDAQKHINKLTCIRVGSQGSSFIMKK